MRKIAALFLLACGFLLMVPAAQASTVLYTNGPATSDTFRCDSNNSNCGSVGWTVLDQFSLSHSAVMTGFSYQDFLVSGSFSDYTSTNWTLYVANPFGTPIDSGTNIFTMSSGDIGAENFSFSGVSIPLSAGVTYWLGFQNNFLDDDLTTRAGASAGYGTFAQYDNGHVYEFYLPGDTAFTVEGTTTAPEAATITLLGVMLLGVVLAGFATKLPERRRLQS